MPELPLHPHSRAEAPIASQAPTAPVALITGGARRIGAAIAHQLATDGWRLVLHFRGSEAEAQALAAQLRRKGAEVALASADLAQPEEVRRLAEDTIQAFGQWDAVVNNASVFEYDNIHSFSPAQLELHLRVNTTAPIVLAQRLAEHLRERPHARGCVVNLLDQKLWNPNPDYLSYTLSKAALESANTLLAQALAPQVRVCGVAPGVTLVSGPAMSAAAFEEAHRMTPLGRSSSPEDIAHAVRYLLKASAVTGTTLLVDGGQHLWGQARDVLFLAPSGPTPAPGPLSAPSPA